MARQFATPILLPADPSSPLHAATKQYADTKAPATHTHAESDVTSLVSDLAGKAPATHTHAESDVTSLTADLAGKVPTTRQIATGTGLSGGGDLSADRTFTVSYGTTSTTACVGNDSRLSDARTPTAHASTHASGGSDPVTPAAIGAQPVRTVYSAGSQGAGTTWTPTYSNGQVQRATASGSTLTVGAPSGGSDDNVLDLQITAGVATSITISALNPLSGISSPISVASGKILLLSLRMISTTWYCLATGTTA